VGFLFGVGGVPAVLEVGGGPGGQRVGAGTQAAGHVGEEQVVPFLGGGQAPFAEFVGVELLGVLRLGLSEMPALEQEVDQRGSAVAARGDPVHSQEATRCEVQTKLFFDFAVGGLPGVLPGFHAAAGDLPGVVPVGRADQKDLLVVVVQDRAGTGDLFGQGGVVLRRGQRRAVHAAAGYPSPRRACGGPSDGEGEDLPCRYDVEDAWTTR
jgi:hypothetical protein